MGLRVCVYRIKKNNLKKINHGNNCAIVHQF